MSRTALELSVKSLEQYHPMDAILQRRTLLKDELAQRKEKALKVARIAAALLRTKFGAGKIILFGSLAKPDCFTFWSDIDLSVEGLPPDRFYDAVGSVISLSSEFKIDIIDPAVCSQSLLSSIETEGISL